MSHTMLKNMQQCNDLVSYGKNKALYIMVKLKGPILWPTLFALKGGLWKQQHKWTVVLYWKAATTKPVIFCQRQICIFLWTFAVIQSYIYLPSIWESEARSAAKTGNIYPISRFMRMAKFHVELLFTLNCFAQLDWAQINVGYEIG